MEQIVQEVNFFISSFLAGVCLLFIYDVVRFPRILWKHGKLWKFVSDYIYWVVAGFFVFVLIYQVNDGAIRGFAIMGMLLGMLSYYMGPQKILIKIVNKARRIFGRMWKKIFRKRLESLETRRKKRYNRSS